MRREVRIVARCEEAEFGVGDMLRLIEIRGHVEALRALLRLAPRLTVSDQLRFAYVILFDRDVDEQGQAIYSLLLRVDTPLLKVLLILASSSEFLGKVDQEIARDDDYLTFIYRRLLRRDIDVSGRDHYLGKLEGGTSRAVVLRAISRSPEARRIEGCRRSILKFLRRAWLCERTRALFGRLPIIVVSKVGDSSTERSRSAADRALLSLLASSAWLEKLPQPRQDAVLAILRGFNAS